MRGFTLIEVIVVAFIVMLGVTGYVTLQSEYVRTDSTLNLRTIATELAQEKLDDLRQFNALESNPGDIAYNDIDDNVGGSIAAGAVDVAIKTGDGQTHQFTRSWAVTEQYFVDTDADGAPDTWLDEGDAGLPAALPAYASQKMVEVTVSFQDNTGAAKQVDVSGSVAPIPVGRSFQATNESDNAKAQPQVVYNPGRAPDVIAYDLGNGENIETSKPVPDIDKQGDNNVVQFETIRYIELIDRTDKLEQEEFLTVNCECVLAGTGEGYTASVTMLDDEELVVKPGEVVTKMTGRVDGVGQPALCEECCRDHHDNLDTVASGSYYRTEGGLPHGHYKRTGENTFVPATSVGSKYDEVCRFKRVNGYFALYTDWQLVDIVQFDDQFLFDDAALAAYINYSENVVAAEVTGGSKPIRPEGRDMTVAPGGYQLISRGIYVDRLTSDHRDAIRAKIAAGDSDWKAITPFYDINLTLLSDWSSKDTNIVTVTQEPIQTIVDPVNDFYGTYSRGRLEALRDGITNTRVFSTAFNSGITGTGAISPVDVSAGVLDDTLVVTVDSKAGTEKFFGLIADINCLITTAGVTESCETNNDLRANFVDLASMDILPSPEQFSCLVNVPKGKSTPFFSCENVSENWNGYMEFTINKPGFTTVYKIQYPDGRVEEMNILRLDSRLVATSNREYSLILEFIE
ncbi:type IV pilus modification PilV family protein [Aestuariibacter salexigens]|uniref:type IV pilus modification PilV family protein n=1 Tax=Aestuariibacter salexigens TaxID=226010 RepID=UPI00041B59F2|nr:hypothetical protein [Aestuariibacter salexigens]